MNSGSYGLKNIKTEHLGSRPLGFVCSLAVVIHKSLMHFGATDLRGRLCLSGLLPVGDVAHCSNSPNQGQGLTDESC